MTTAGLPRLVYDGGQTLDRASYYSGIAGWGLWFRGCLSDVRRSCSSRGVLQMWDKFHLRRAEQFVNSTGAVAHYYRWVPDLAQMCILLCVSDGCDDFSGGLRATLGTIDGELNEPSTSRPTETQRRFLKAADALFLTSWSFSGSVLDTRSTNSCPAPCRTIFAVFTYDRRRFHT